VKNQFDPGACCRLYLDMAYFVVNFGLQKMDSLREGL